MLFYKVWFTKLAIFLKTELINSEFLQYFHSFFHKLAILVLGFCLFVAAVLKLVSWIKNFSQSTLRRKDIKEYEAYKNRSGCIHKKEILLNSLHSKKTLRLCVLGVRFYINYSVTCLFDATMPEKYLG